MHFEDRSAGYQLLETGTLVDFQIVKTHVQAGPDGENLYVYAELLLGTETEEDQDPEDIAEWGAFGFLFVLATLSFAEARPRGHSDIEYVEGDEFRVADFFECLRYVRGELRFCADYLRGRCLKTDIAIRPNGSVILTTRGRGESALRWLDKLKGKRLLRVV